MAAQQNYPQATFVSVPLNTTPTQSEKERIEKLFPKKTMKDLSTAQLIFAGIAALAQVHTTLIFKFFAENIMILHLLKVILIANGEAYIGTGIWTGFVFAIAGGVGLMASQRPSYSMVTAFMVLSIIASIFALILIVVSGIGMGRYSYRSRSSSRFLFGMELLIGLAEGIVAITTAAFCCRVTCISPHRQNNVAFTRTGQEFTDIPISPLPMPMSSGAMHPPTMASAVAGGAVAGAVAGAVGQSLSPAPPAYKERQESQDDEDPLGLQDPWQRFE